MLFADSCIGFLGKLGLLLRICLMGQILNQDFGL